MEVLLVDDIEYAIIPQKLDETHSEEHRKLSNKEKNAQMERNIPSSILQDSNSSILNETNILKNTIFTEADNSLNITVFNNASFSMEPEDEDIVSYTHFDAIIQQKEIIYEPLNYKQKDFSRQFFF